jgi:cyanate permease
VLNAYTRLSSQWFPSREHATATGLAALSQYVGFVVAMGLTPPMVQAVGIDGMLQVYGAATVVAAAAFLVVFREHPPTPPSAFDAAPRLSVWAGLRHIARQPQMLLLIYVFFIGIGVFNAVSTWIEEILAPRGFTPAQAGMAGAIMMIGGIVGALIVPPLSDRAGRRVPFLVGCTALAVPGLAGFAFATGYPALLGFSFLLGFAVLSAGPVGFEYGAELAHPAPESTAQGLLLLGGQISGIVFIFGMDALRESTGSMTPFLVFFILATALNVLLGLFLREARQE